MKKIQLIIAVFIAQFVLLASTLSMPSIAYGQSAKDSACKGVALTGGSCDGKSSEKVTTVVKTVINILSWVIGVTAVIMVMIGGFKYITSTGDSNSVNSAKNTILYALVGLVIAVLAQVIVKFVVGKI